MKGKEKQVSENGNKVVLKGSKKIVVLIVGIMAILLLGMQVFASTNGYGNVFFMIKELITPTNVEGESEIFSDKEITLSYKSIDIAEGVKMQVNRLEIKENESTLCLHINSTDENKVLPLTYEWMSEGLDKTEVKGSKETKGEFDERLTVKYTFSDDELMTLYVKDKDGNLLRELEINLNSHEIYVKGESEAEKISQIELKKYLGIFSELNNEVETNDALIMMAIEYREKILDARDAYALSELNEIVKEMYGEKAVFEKAKDSKGKEIEVLKFDKNNGWGYEAENDSYIAEEEFNDYKRGICLKIEDIKYDAGIYTVKYIYTLAGSADIYNDKIEELPQYEATIKLKVNKDAKYSKYQVVELSKATTIKEAVNKDETDTEVDEQRDESDENVPCEHMYKVVKNPGNDYHTSLDGEHELVCEACGATTKERHNFGKWYTINNGTAWTLWCTDCMRYVYTTDYSVVENSGYEMNDPVTETPAQSEVNTKSEKYTSVTIIDSRLEYGPNYSIFYTNPAGEYRTAYGYCDEAGKISTDFYGKDGEYTLCLITKTDDTKEMIIPENTKCTITNREVNKKEFAGITATIENDSFEVGKEYDVFYVTPNGEYRNNKAMCNAEGKVVINAKGTSGVYKLGVIVGENNETIQPNGFSFEVDNFGNAK